jgi:hypothetical protein
MRFDEEELGVRHLGGIVGRSQKSFERRPRLGRPAAIYIRLGQVEAASKRQRRSHHQANACDHHLGCDQQLGAEEDQHNDAPQNRITD